MATKTLIVLHMTLVVLEVLAREPCIHCVYSEKKDNCKSIKAICLSANSWTPNENFENGKKYECDYAEKVGNMICLEQHSEKDEVCGSTETCGFKQDGDLFKIGTKCFIDMNNGSKGHTSEQQQQNNTSSSCVEPLSEPGYIVAISFACLFFLTTVILAIWISRKGCKNCKKRKKQQEPTRPTTTNSELQNLSQDQDDQPPLTLSYRNLEHSEEHSNSQGS